VLAPEFDRVTTLEDNPSLGFCPAEEISLTSPGVSGFVSTFLGLVGVTGSLDIKFLANAVSFSLSFNLHRHFR
jgi:hypothetical protein